MSDPTTRQIAIPAVRNEQLKLAATACNNLGVALIITGGLAPAVAFTYQLGQLPHGRFWAIFVLFWLSIGLAGHIAGRLILKGLK